MFFFLIFIFYNLCRLSIYDVIRTYTIALFITEYKSDKHNKIPMFDKNGEKLIFFCFFAQFIQSIKDILYKSSIHTKRLIKKIDDKKLQYFENNKIFVIQSFKKSATSITLLTPNENAFELIRDKISFFNNYIIDLYCIFRWISWKIATRNVLISVVHVAALNTCLLNSIVYTSLSII